MAGGFNDDFDDLDEEMDQELDDSADADDEFAFDDEDAEEKAKKKQNAERQVLFNKEKLITLTGTVRPKERSKEGKVVSLDFKVDGDKVYVINMDTMGTKLLTMCFQELQVRGHVTKVSEKEYSLTVRSYL